MIRLGQSEGGRITYRTTVSKYIFVSLVVGIVGQVEGERARCELRELDRIRRSDPGPIRLVQHHANLAYPEVPSGKTLGKGGRIVLPGKGENFVSPRTYHNHPVGHHALGLG